MGHWHDPAAASVVALALRKYTDAVQRNLTAYDLDPARSEEIDEAIRWARAMRCAASLIGSFALHRVASLLEEVLHAAGKEGCALEAAAATAVRAMVAAIASYSRRLESCAGDSVKQPRQELTGAILAYRRYRGLPAENDERAISDLFHAAWSDSDICIDEGQPGVHNGGAGRASAGDRLAADAIAPELLEVFRAEAEQCVERIYGALRGLNSRCDNREQFQQIRRAAHTLKGSAAAVRLHTVQQLSHRMEDLLDTIYNGSAPLSQDHQHLLASTTDMLHDLSTTSAGEQAHLPRLQELLARYDRCCEAKSGPAVRSDTQSERGVAQGAERGAAGQSATERRQSTLLRVPADRIDDLRGIVGELTIRRNSMEQRFGHAIAGVVALQPVIDRLRGACRDLEGLRVFDGGQKKHDGGTPEENARLPGPENEFAEEECGAGVDLGAMAESLATCSGDLSAIAKTLRGVLKECEASFAEQGRLTRRVREELITIQRIPFGRIVPRLDRAVRELASIGGKTVELVVAGEEIAMDKIVLEEMVEPLLHLIRNAVDHGIEAPDQRRKKRKPAQGTVRLSLSHYDTQVVIEVCDDGQGLGAEEIRAAAVRGGFVGEEESQTLAAQQLYSYIFLPGFTTARSVNETSGRGVGTDIVRSRIEELGGQVDVDSTVDGGTSFTIRLPVGLAVTRALVLVANDQAYAIPERVITAVHRIVPGDVIGGAERKLLVDGRALRLIALHDHLGLEAAGAVPPERGLVAVVSCGSQRVAVQVDGVLPGRDIVVKPLGDGLLRPRGLLGATILGDGSVLPVLDPIDLLWRSDESCNRRLAPC